MEPTPAVTCELSRRHFLAGLGLLLHRSATPGRDASLRLITRADDLGCARSLNRAAAECVTNGIARNISVLAPTPYVAEAAADLASRQDICFGLHTALNSEWTERRWGPVAPRETVRSLIDRDGMLHQYPDALKDADPDEALREFSAQLRRTRKLGFTIRYADSHMGAVGRVPGLAAKFRTWCKANKIINANALGAERLKGLPNYWSRPDRRKDADFPDALLAAIKAADRSKLHVLVGHPAYDEIETRRLSHEGYPGDAVASNLNLERLGFVSDAIVRYCRSDAVELLRYDQV